MKCSLQVKMKMGKEKIERMDAFASTHAPTHDAIYIINGNENKNENKNENVKDRKK